MNDSLFGDVMEEVPAAPTVIRGRSGIGDQVEQAWLLWVDLTGRHDGKNVHRKFRAEYTDLLKRNYDHQEMLAIIQGAARLEPRPRDPQDVRRVIMPLTSFAHERTALNALKEDLPVIPFPEPKDEMTATLRDVERACDVPRSDWTEGDLEAAGILIVKLTPQELDEAGAQVALHIQSERVLPTDLLRHYRAVKRGKLSAQARASRDSYNAGRTESATIKDVRFAADPASERKLLKGADPEQVVAFHLSAPENYWDRVMEELVARPTAEPKGIYAELESEFDGWHPSHRNTSKG